MPIAGAFPQILQQLILMARSRAALYYLDWRQTAPSFDAEPAAYSKGRSRVVIE